MIAITASIMIISIILAHLTKGDHSINSQNYAESVLHGPTQIKGGMGKQHFKHEKHNKHRISLGLTKTQGGSKQQHNFQK